jgi:hypothetical protein
MAGQPELDSTCMLAAWPRGDAVSQANDPRVDAADLVRRWVHEIFNDRNLSAADDLMADTYVEHAVAPFGRDEPGPMNGPDGMRRTVA